MAISRAQLLKELLPGLNALFGLEYQKYGEQHTEIFESETSERSFEEETKLSGFGQAPVKDEGSSISYDNAQEAWTSRYTHETIALGFSITEEAVEDNLYDSLSSRYTKALARAMAYTKQTKAAAVLNNGFNSSYTGGDGVELFQLHTHLFLVALTLTNQQLRLILTKLLWKRLLFRLRHGLTSAACSLRLSPKAHYSTSSAVCCNSSVGD